MQLSRLANAPQHADALALWLWQEWHDHSRLSLEATKARLLDPGDCPPTLVALIDGEPVGVVAFRWFWRAGEPAISLFIDALYVHESSRGLGIGSALLSEAIGCARPFIPKLFVFTEKRAWYESRGWELVDAKPQSTSAVLVCLLAR